MSLLESKAGDDDFAKLQFQVGEIIACEAVKKIEAGFRNQLSVRQIVSRIEAHSTHLKKW